MERWQGQTALSFWHAIFLNSRLFFFFFSFPRFAPDAGRIRWLIISVLDDAMIHLGIRIEPRRRRKEEEHGGRIAVAAVSFAGRNINTPDEASSKLRLERYSISLTADEPEASARRHAARKKNPLLKWIFMTFHLYWPLAAGTGNTQFLPFAFVCARSTCAPSPPTYSKMDAISWKPAASFFRFLNWIPALGFIVWYLLAPSVPYWERFFIP